MENKNGYKERIEREEMYWSGFEAEAYSYGVPWWCDLRKATKLTKVICGWMHDPGMERILRGDCKEALIETASRRKGNALDLGCGAGWLSLELARRGMRVDGLEISRGRLAVAGEYLKKNMFQEGFGSIHYRIQDINQASLKENNYESVVSWDSLHHIPGIERLMKEVCGSLKPGGCLAFYDHIGLGAENRRLVRLLRIPLAALTGLIRLFAERDSAVAPAPAPRIRQEILISPFEDVTQKEMVAAVKRFFAIEVCKTQLSFSAALANDLIPLPDIIKYPLLCCLKFIDEVLIKTRILEGEYVLVIARKQEAR